MTTRQFAAKLRRMIGLIYKIENQVNGKVYIGLTTQSLNCRKAEHMHRLRDGKRQHKLYQAMRKHGVENFTFTQIASVLSDIGDVEMDIISQYDSYGRGYNATPGGDVVSEETKQKLSEMFKGREMTWADKGVETRRKNGTMPQKGQGGYGKENANSKSYVAETPSGDMVTFKGLRQFCRDNSLSHNLLLTTLSGVQTHHKGFKLLRKFND